VRKVKGKPEKKLMVHGFRCQDLLLAVPREIAARVAALTAKKRTRPDAYDEAIAKFEAELATLTGGAPLTAETWGGKGRAKDQADLVAAAAVLLSFGVSAYPVPADQEAAARALAGPTEPATA
jgi:hypothetical protein